MAKDYRLIQSQTVSGSSTNTLTFATIPQTYKHLVLHINARSTAANTRDTIILRPNNNSTANAYSSFFMFGYDATGPVQSQSTSSSYYEWQYLMGNTATANLFGSTTVNLHNYTSSTGVKTVNTILANENNSTSSWIDGITTGYWNNTAAIDSLYLYTQSGNTLIAGSVFSLYGIN